MADTFAVKIDIRLFNHAHIIKLAHAKNLIITLKMCRYCIVMLRQSAIRQLQNHSRGVSRHHSVNKSSIKRQHRAR